MKYKNILHLDEEVTFETAILQGVGKAGGLFVPSFLPSLSNTFTENLASYDLFEIAYTILSAFIDDIPEKDLKNIIQKTFHFPIPVVPLEKPLYLLELFHGPTLAFKDVGVRFIAEVLSFFLRKKQKRLTLLVATSGDTGSAVAHGFYQMPLIDVYILYPSQKVSSLQEKQMTTFDDNIHAIEVEGTFDDCQTLVKLSLEDADLKSTFHITTANSINVGRLLPQIVYYFFGLSQMPATRSSVVVPSGNFGNLTAAAYAQAMGAPIKKLIAATNSNTVVPDYLNTGDFKPRKSKKTLSNAMDVGHPNNFIRLQALYDYNYEKIKKALKGISISDEKTLKQIQDTYQKSQYILDPHTAVGVAAAFEIEKDEYPVMVASTAHPAKFPECIKDALHFEIPLPEALQNVMVKPKLSTHMKNDFMQWKKFLQKNLRG